MGVKLDFRARTTCFRCLGKVGDFGQWEIRTWELLAGEVDQSGGRRVSEPPNITHSPGLSQLVSHGGDGAAWGMGPRTPLGGGSSPLAAAFSRAAGYCTEKSEGHRRPWGAARRRGPGILLSTHPPCKKRERARNDLSHRIHITC